MIELYEDVLTIAKSYMGIAAEDYVSKRCRVSFNLEIPGEIKQEHLDRLAESIGMTAEVYMSGEKVRQFKSEILNLKDKHY
jgi:hypothetical protein